MRKLAFKAAQPPKPKPPPPRPPRPPPPPPGRSGITDPNAVSGSPRSGECVDLAAVLRLEESDEMRIAPIAICATAASWGEGVASRDKSRLIRNIWCCRSGLN
jgi:hypothetical protein